MVDQFRNDEALIYIRLSVARVNAQIHNLLLLETPRDFTLSTAQVVSRKVDGMLFFLLLLTLSPFVQQATCWGSLGHRTVAYLAQKHFTDEANVLVNSLLNGEDISDAALWPDEVRRSPGYKFSAEWHFIGRRWRLHGGGSANHAGDRCK